MVPQMASKLPLKKAPNTPRKKHLWSLRPATWRAEFGRKSTSKSTPKSVPGRVPGRGFRGPPGGVRRGPEEVPEGFWRGFRGVPGGVRRLRRGSEGSRGGPGGVRGRFWADLGANLGAFGRPPAAIFGFFGGSFFRCSFRCASEADLGPILGPKMGPKGAPKEPGRSFETEGWKSQILSNPPMFFAYFGLPGRSEIGPKFVTFSLQLRMST